jgi:uncharacterized protein
MSTLYTATVGVFAQVLPPIARLVDKAEAHCREHGLPPEALTEARLAPDMWNFAHQMMCAVRYSADAVDALSSGVSSPYVGPPPTDFASLREVLTAAVARIEAATPDEIAQGAAREVRYEFGSGGMLFTGEDYLLSFALPNFFFHATAAYAVLRAQGVPVGKRDYLGAVRAQRY